MDASQEKNCPQKCRCRHRAIVTLEISCLTELPSAQQRMYALVVSRVIIRREHEHDKVLDGSKGHKTRNVSDPDRRERWWSLSFPISLNCTDGCTCRNDHKSLSTENKATSPNTMKLQTLINSLRQSKNRVVLREWRQGASWWNLNMNHEHEFFSDYHNNHEERKTISPRPKPLRGSALHPKCHQKIIRNIKSTGKTTISMASAEVAGYRLSRAAMEFHSCNTPKRIDKTDVPPYKCNDIINSKSGEKARTRVVMPEVLYFSHDHDNDDHSPSLLEITFHTGDGERNNICQSINEGIKTASPWALLSYFGDESQDGMSKDEEVQTKLVIDCSIELDFDLDQLSTTAFSDSYSASSLTTTTTMPCRHYPTTMTKIRHEFGFDEPHPRHGRVPEDECLDYAMMILRDVILPIQSSFFVNQNPSLGKNNTPEALNNNMFATTEWDGEVAKNASSLGWCNDESGKTNSFEYRDMIALYHHALNRLREGHSKQTPDNRMENMLEILRKCIDGLSNVWNAYGGHPPHLPPVVCHMDLQPQNLQFWHNTPQISNDNCKQSNGNQLDQSRHNVTECSVASVMDWEEACYADPRFELLLLCRKVLANREQANVIWSMYSEQVWQWGGEVGPLEPWLKLETVHSICTLMLQGMDLLGGGRNPWETKPDLWGKIDRERLRLVRMGWPFCNLSSASS